MVLFTHYEHNHFNSFNWNSFKESIKMRFFDDFKRGMNSFGKIISTIINTLLLLLVYILGVGLTSIIARALFRKEFLEEKISKNTKTYWSNLNLKGGPLESYYRQF